MHLTACATTASTSTLLAIERTEKAVSFDETLTPYFPFIYQRNKKFYETLTWINDHESGFEAFTSSYKAYGMHPSNTDPNTIECLEYLPEVKGVWLIGDFNQWNFTSHPFTSIGFGKWSLKIPPMVNAQKIMVPAIEVGSIVKLYIHTCQADSFIVRLSPWSTYCLQNEETKLLESVYYPLEILLKAPENIPVTVPKIAPLEEVVSTAGESLLIYEVHIGIASSEPHISSFHHFRQAILPKIHKLGYNCIQFMAIQEHAYYASFGYQVTSFFGISSRFGTPQDFYELVAAAKALGIRCIVDLVHSHASKNTLDGLNDLNGTPNLYFHAPPRGNHPLWDSRVFDYGSIETLRFLLSNVRYLLEVFKLDGFRMDGVTSMLYLHHGANKQFTKYEDYFNLRDPGVADLDAQVYLMLVNYLCGQVSDDRQGRSIVTIAEDVSGMPTLCRPLAEGGFGFNYRLAMSIPEVLVKLVTQVRDEDWNMEELCHVLLNRRQGEKVVAYVESHDQCLVGDKTFAFWMMDHFMYTHMSNIPSDSSLKDHGTLVIERGIALHKLFRLLVATLGGDAYLNFMGNEFGHPEWLDFPREGNHWR